MVRVRVRGQGQVGHGGDHQAKAERGPADGPGQAAGEG